MSANDLMELRERDEPSFRRCIERVQFEKYRFRLRYKIETYNDELRPNATVDRVEKIDQSSLAHWNDVRKQISEIEGLLEV